MTIKEKLYQFIRTNPTTFEEWRAFQSKCPQVRLKTVGSKRNVLICLDGTNDWMEPAVWASNYRASIKLRFEQECQRAKNILSQEVMLKTVGYVEQKAEVDKEALFKAYSDALFANRDRMVLAAGDADWKTFFALQVDIIQKAIDARLTDDSYVDIMQRLLDF